MTGYGDPRYVGSLGHFGQPIDLPGSGGSLLRRTIDAGRADAIGTYPFLVCRDWGALAADLGALANDLVSIVAVPDPLGEHTLADLEAAFPDLLVPYKRHYLVYLRSKNSLGKHHRRNLRRAAELVEVERVVEPIAEQTTWCGLYANLIDRHHVEGIAHFSDQALVEQLSAGGLTMFCARQDGRAVGMALFYTAGDDVYYHLGAYNAAGYAAKASYALFDSAIKWFRAEGGRRLLLGSGAGLSSDATDGLSRFKRGWATDSMVGYLGGRIGDRGVYDALSEGFRGDYFPAYRSPLTMVVREGTSSNA